MNKIITIFKKISRLILPKVIVVGIDVQERHVAMVANTRRADTGGDYISGVEELPEGTIVEGEVKNHHAFYNALEKLMQRIPVSKLKHELVVVLSLPPTHMYSEFSFFPRMPFADLEEAVRLKVETSIPWPSEEAYVDWKAREVEDNKKTGVFLVAIHKPLLEGYLQVFRKGGWRVAACEFHLLSMTQVEEVGEKTENHLFILIDEDGAEFAVFHRDDIMMHFIKKIEQDPSGDENERKDFKAKLGFEAKRLIAFAESELQNKIEEVHMFNKVGLEAELEQLEKEIDIPVKYFAPHKNPALYIALGASYRKFSIPEKTVNFLPQGSGGRYNENLILRTLDLWTRMVGVFSLVMIVLFAGFYLVLGSQQSTLQQEKNALSNTFNTQTSRSSEELDFAKEFNALVGAASTAFERETMMGKRLAYFYEIAEEVGIDILSMDHEVDDVGRINARIAAPDRDAILTLKNRIEDPDRTSKADATSSDETATSSENEIDTTTSTEEVPDSKTVDEDKAKLLSGVEVPLTQLAKEENLTVNIVLLYE